MPGVSFSLRSEDARALARGSVARIQREIEKRRAIIPRAVGDNCRTTGCAPA